MSRLLVASARVCASALLALALGATAARAASPPTALCSVAGATPQPCQSTTWYTAPVTLTWASNGSSLVNPAECQAHTYGQDTNESAEPADPWNQCPYSYGTGSGRRNGSVTSWINVEVSAPSVSANAARPPDQGGWYNHPVAVSFAGTSFSGVASCSAPQTYAGPDTAAQTLTGSCTDKAGKTATAGYLVHYDATPPTIALKAVAVDESVRITWNVSSTPAPLESIKLSRTPGTGRQATSVLYNASPETSFVYNGSSQSFHDTRVTVRTRYRYTLTVTDAAGNVSVRQVSVRTRPPHLIAPITGAPVNPPVTLSWTPVPGASYYNVQLYHGGKILSRWPLRANLTLRATWTYQGSRHTLHRGRYRWYVWPGYGSRARAHYGPAIGSGTFVVR